MRHLAPFGAVLAVLGLAACGASEEDQIEDVVRDFAAGYGSGDLELACKQLTPASRGELIRRGRELGARSCEQVLAQVQELTGGRTDLPTDRDVGIEEIDVDGTRATVRLDRVRAPLRAAQVDGVWKVELG